MEMTIARDGVEVGGVPLDTGDRDALLPHLGASVALERGITGADVFAALMPWSAALSLMGDLDMAEWGRALARSHLSVAGDPPRGLGLSSVVIAPEATVVGTDGFRIDWTTSARAASEPDTRYAVPGDVRAWGRLGIELRDAVTLPWGGGRAATLVPTFYDAIVLGFLADVSFDGSPADARGTEDEVAALAADLRAGLADRALPVPRRDA